MTESKITIQEARALANKLIEDDIIKILPHIGGANNCIFFIETPNAQYALKNYLHTPGDKHDRYYNEVTALKFLNNINFPKNSTVGVPAILHSDRSSNIMIMQWQDGIQPLITPRNVASLSCFVEILLNASNGKQNLQIPNAIECCLSAQNLELQLIARYNNLCTPDVPECPDKFLREDVLPLQKHYLNLAKQMLGNTWTIELKKDLQILSPSDFGFHNALQLKDGKIIFLDFEYFGWDDPVKLISDTCWHPGMNLNTVHISSIILHAKTLFQNDPSFHLRLEALYPLYAIRWIYIILADFLPDRWLRRQKAGINDTWENVRKCQFVKARTLLKRIKSETLLVSNLIKE